jgi:hypothetical protein
MRTISSIRAAALVATAFRPRAESRPTPSQDWTTIMTVGPTAALLVIDLQKRLDEAVGGWHPETGVDLEGRQS